MRAGLIQSRPDQRRLRAPVGDWARKEEYIGSKVRDGLVVPPNRWGYISLVSPCRISRIKFNCAKLVRLFRLCSMRASIVDWPL